MSKLSGFLLRLRRVFQRRAFEAQMADEMREHLEQEIAGRIAAGEDPAAARRRAAVEFGHADSLKEKIRDRRLGRALEQTVRELRHAARALRRTPAFSAAVIVTIALGFGINAVVFTFAYSILFKPVPVADGDRLVTVSDANMLRTNRPALSWPEFLAYREGTTALEALEAGAYGGATITEADVPPEQYAMMRLTPGMFDLVPATPVLGRSFSARDGQAGAEPVVVIGFDLWQSRYDGAKDVLGRSIRVNDMPATIIGVMPDGFKFPGNEALWLPLVPTPQLEQRTNRELLLFGRLKHGVTTAQATQDLAVITGRLAAEFPGEAGEVPVLVRTFHATFLGGPALSGLYVLMGAVTLVLLIAGANVANMMLSRGLARVRETSVRAALGASRWQIIRQVLAESVLLSCAGGLLGVVLTRLGVGALVRATQGVGLPYWLHFEMDAVVVGYLVIVSIVTGIAFGFVPALRATRIGVTADLRVGSPIGGGRRESRLTGALVVVQFACTITLLGSAGLFWRSFLALQEYNPAVQPDEVLTGRIELPQGAGAAYAEPAARRQFIDRLRTELAALPGVTHVAVGSHLPGVGANRSRVEIEGRPVVDAAQAPGAGFIVQAPGYLATIRLPLLEGRDLEAGDGQPGHEGAVVTRTFARALWPDESAVGKRFRFLFKDAPGPWVSVVGETGDLIDNPTATGPSALVFLPDDPVPPGRFFFLLRTTSDPHALVAPVRVALQGIDPSLPVYQVQLLTAAIDHPRWMMKFLGSLFVIFSVTGLAMSAVGIHAVVAHATRRRTHEIGIRMALGATGARVVRLVLARGVRQLVIGLALGLVGAAVLPLGFKQAGMLMQVSPHDPFVFAGITIVMVMVGVFACWTPARRASRLNPSEALRRD